MALPSERRGKPSSQRAKFLPSLADADARASADAEGVDCLGAKEGYGVDNSIDRCHVLAAQNENSVDRCLENFCRKLL